MHGLIEQASAVRAGVEPVIGQFPFNYPATSIPSLH